MSRIEEVLLRAEQDCQEAFAERDAVERATFARVLAALREHRVASRHFAPTTGYGYDDIGRDTLEKVFAQAFACEDALVRPQIVSGTHSLAVSLFGLLRPGDTLVSAAGKPYDTLDEVIGIAGSDQGSLKEYGVSYRQVDLLPDGAPDYEGIARAAKAGARVVLVQRSKGYAWRPSLTPEEIGRVAEAVHRAQPSAVVLVDNCYGEFACEREPVALGADLMAGSLIKNPGGGLAPTGGYVAGKTELVEQVAYRLTSPGIGREVGSYAQGYQPFYQGLFLAPHTVAQAVKTAILASRVFELLGYEVHPRYDAPRSDIIQAIRLGSPELLIAFCQGIQAASPVDSFALPEPWEMPGYQDPVIMAAGTFVSGASIELSADAPLRPPYNVYLQGGLTYVHGRLALETVLRRILEGGRNA